MRKNPEDYTVIPAKCARSKDMFGIRGVRHDGEWHLTWAFKMTERQARGEHIENNTLSGKAVFDESYPKCPHCGNDSLIVCHKCGRVTCVAEETVKEGGRVTCAWCGFTAKSVINNDITGTKGGGF